MCRFPTTSKKHKQARFGSKTQATSFHSFAWSHRVLSLSNPAAALSSVVIVLQDDIIMPLAELVPF
jgi:hypothetical protein